MSNNLDTSNESKRQRSLWLSRYGGWVLLAGSIVLIALAALFSRRAAVAPIFALGGIALVILGVLLPRIEGVFEFNTTPSGRRADIIAERDGELLVIEVKDDRGTRNWADVRYQLNRIREGLQHDLSPRIALFLGQPPPSQILSRIVGDGFEVWIRNDDGFERMR